MKYVIAFDKFKGSLSALEACGIAAKVIQQKDAQANLVIKPLTDGGEGFCEILTTAAGGFLQNLKVTNAVGVSKNAHVGWVQLERLSPAALERLQLGTQGKLAIVELAQAAGIQELGASQRNPWRTCTYGVGEMLQWVAKSGADAILLGLGGSATNDLGAGALQALGLKGYDSEGRELECLAPENWQRCVRLDASALSKVALPPLRIACDVDNPLLGERGSTKTFARQKGLPPEELDHMETEVQMWAEKLAYALERPNELGIYSRHTPGAGAAGGIGFGLLTAFTCTEFIRGADLVLEWLNIERDLQDADWLITGEGRFDSSSLGGKGPYALLQMAKSKRSLLCCGSIEQGIEESLSAQFPNLRCVAVSPPELPLQQALDRGPELLKKALLAQNLWD